MTNYLASDGIHLDNMGATVESSSGPVPAAYATILSYTRLGNAGIWANITWDYGTWDDEEYLELNIGESQSAYRSFAIRLA